MCQDKMTSAPTPVETMGNNNGAIPVANGTAQNFVNNYPASPYMQMMQQHPILGSLATGAMAFGQGLTKQPYYTDFMNNQAALQGKQMENQYNVWQQTQSPQALAMAEIYKSLYGGGSGGGSPSFDWTKVEGYDADKGISYNPAKQKMQYNRQTGSYKIVNR